MNRRPVGRSSMELVDSQSPMMNSSQPPPTFGHGVIPPMIIDSTTQGTEAPIGYANLPTQQKKHTIASNLLTAKNDYYDDLQSSTGGRTLNTLGTLNTLNGAGGAGGTSIGGKYPDFNDNATVVSAITASTVATLAATVGGGSTVYNNNNNNNNNNRNSANNFRNTHNPQQTQAQQQVTQSQQQQQQRGIAQSGQNSPVSMGTARAVAGGDSGSGPNSRENTANLTIAIDPQTPKSYSNHGTVNTISAMTNITSITNQNTEEQKREEVTNFLSVKFEIYFL